MNEWTVLGEYNRGYTSSGVFLQGICREAKRCDGYFLQEASRWFGSIVPGDEKDDVEFVINCLRFGDKGYIRLLLKLIRRSEPFFGSFYFVFVSGLERQAHDADSLACLRTYFLHCCSAEPITASSWAIAESDRADKKWKSKLCSWCKYVPLDKQLSTKIDIQPLTALIGSPEHC